MLAGYYDQVSGDSGAGNRIGPFKGRVTAVGATAAYNDTVAGTPVTTRLKVLREVYVENRPKAPWVCSPWRSRWAVMPLWSRHDPSLRNTERSGHGTSALFLCRRHAGHGPRNQVTDHTQETIRIKT